MFIGAFAVMFHTKSGRRTRDLDLVMATELSNDDLLNKKYKIFNENGKEVIYSPREIKVDINNKRAINKIPIKEIINSSKKIEIGKKNDYIKIANLEIMIVAKLRAGRVQDREDFQELIRYNSKKINWSLMDKLAEPIEIGQIKNMIKYMQ